MISVFALGPWRTSLPLTDYLRTGQVWAYIPRNLALYPVTYPLPGVFEHNFSPAVNGSLWSLRLEFSCYIMVAVAGLLGLVRRWPLAAAYGLSLALLGVAVALGPRVPAQAATFFANVALFLAGAAIRFWPARGQELVRLPGRGAALLALALILVASTRPAIGTVILPALLALPVLAFALHPIPGIAHWGRIGDLSYGLYIWAFPVQQILIERAHGRLDPLLLIGETMAIIVPIAAFSWWMIERPALALKSRLIHDCEAGVRA